MKITPRTVYGYLINRLIRAYLKRSNRHFGRNTYFKKIPLIETHRDAKIVLGNNVVINSNNKGYHVNMFTRCKLMADRPEAYIEIGDRTRIHGSCIHAYSKISIGKDCLVAANCQIIDANGHTPSFDDLSKRMLVSEQAREIKIEDHVWLATGVVVLPGVTIGRGSIITANSVVNRDIPPMVVAGGNPIKIIRDYNQEA